MKNKKHIALLITCLLMTTLSFSQDTADTDTVAPPVNNVAVDTANNTVIVPGAPPANTANLPVVTTDPDAAGVGLPNTADENLTTVLVENFEYPQGWFPSIPLDFGISKLLYRDGGPEEVFSADNKMTLGVKTVFFRRNFGWMSIDRPYPLSLKNIVKTFSVWVAGRNKQHVFYIKVRDIENNRMRLSGGPMLFRGWKKLIIPVTEPVVQISPSVTAKGLDFLGFFIAFNAESTSTTEPYYIYLDQLTATMNILPAQASDDMSDDW